MIKSEDEIIEFLKTRFWVFQIKPNEKEVLIKGDINSMRIANRSKVLSTLKKKYGWKIDTISKQP